MQWTARAAVCLAIVFQGHQLLAATCNYRRMVLADQPVAYWSFDQSSRTDSGDSTELSTTAVGKLDFAAPGPRPKLFPDFDEQNGSLRIDGIAYITVDDPGSTSPLDFALNDAITLEAWVNPVSVPSGSYAYILGKGRTGNPGMSANNQNYALRLAGSGGGAGIAFLFRSAGPDGEWHRWTSDAVLTVGDGWHHVAVTYVFGQRDSVRGYVDGELVSGEWDMGGATDRAPVVDDDQLWIGSSMGGSKSSTFNGALDELAVYRQALPAERLQQRYKYVAGQPDPDPADVPKDTILVELFEGIPDSASWRFRSPYRVDQFAIPSMAPVELPNAYSDKGVTVDRANPLLLKAHGWVHLPPEPCRLLLRCRNASRLYLDGKQVAETEFHKISASGHGKVYELDRNLTPHIRPLQRGDTQCVYELQGDSRDHLLRLEMIVGGRKRRPELGETSVSLAVADDEFQLISPLSPNPLTNNGWTAFVAAHRQWLQGENRRRREAASVHEREYWEQRHQLARQQLEAWPTLHLPSTRSDCTENNSIDRFVNAKLAEVGVAAGELTDDYQFLRRVTLDVLGIVPTAKQIDKFLADDHPDRRSRWIDRLLEDPHWADNWVGYWQDVLAENPNIVNPTLNNTGPFRWWIHESFLDNKPFDRFVTELVMMEGSQYFGGPAGFSLATQNDVPFAAKAHIVGQAFLSLEMKCARCHDAPYHDFRQEDLFSLAAMLGRGEQQVPISSSIPGGDDAVNSLLVEVTLKPGSKVAPKWSFPDLVPDEIPNSVLREPDDQRERLAALITSGQNQRFAQTLVNRMWRRYLGLGLIEPVDDWQDATASNPALLDHLAREFVQHGYDLKYIARLILNSQAYQRQACDPESVQDPAEYHFAAPVRRRMSAEQLVDSLFSAAEMSFDAGHMCIDIDGSRPETLSLNLGQPNRAWQFASLSNERDRPSLALPFAQPFVTLMETFGWRSSRQNPLTIRNEDPNVLQPAVISNGVIGTRIVRLSDNNGFTRLVMSDTSLDQLIQQVYLRLLTRLPSTEEQQLFSELLGAGFADRIVAAAKPAPERDLRRNWVSWSNHLHPEATVIKTELEVAVREGYPPTPRLTTDWRERMEDMLWVLVNSPEFVYLP